MSKAVGIGIAVVVIVAAGGGGYYYVSQQATHKVIEQIQKAEKTYPGLKITYEKVSTNVFSKSATFDKVVVTAPDGHIYDAVKAEIAVGDNNQPKNIILDQFHTKIDRKADLTINQIKLDNLNFDKDAFVIRDGKLQKVNPDKITFDLLDLNNIKISDPDDKNSLKVAEFQIKNYGLNRLSDQILKQFDVSVPSDDVAIKVGLIQVNGLNLGTVLTQALNGEVPVVTPGEPTYASIADVSYKAGGKEFSIAKYEGKTNKEASGNLKNTTIFNDLKIAVGTDYRLQPLQELGYKDLNLSGNLQYEYDKSKGQWNFDPIVFNLKDMGQITAAVKMLAPENLSNKTPADMMTKYKLVSVKLTLQNGGLLARMLETASKNNKMSQDQVKQQWTESLKKDAEKATVQAQKQADQAAIQVLNNPTDKIILTVNPAKPVGLVDFMGQPSQEQIINTLNVNVTTEAVKK